MGRLLGWGGMGRLLDVEGVYWSRMVRCMVYCLVLRRQYASRTLDAILLHLHKLVERKALIAWQLD